MRHRNFNHANQEAYKAKRLTIPNESREQYEYAAEALIALGEMMKKALRQKKSFFLLQLECDYLIQETHRDLKANGNGNAKYFDYKGAK